MFYILIITFLINIGQGEPIAPLDRGLSSGKSHAFGVAFSQCSPISF
jgi:hypothetical protein